MDYTVRSEVPQDADTIATLITVAFEGVEHSDGNEAAIVEGLRSAGGAIMLLSVLYKKYLKTGEWHRATIPTK